MWRDGVPTNGIPIGGDYPQPMRFNQRQNPTILNLRATAITISPDGRFLAVSVGAAPFDVQIWDIDQGCLLSRLEGHVVGARWLKFFSDGNRLRSTAWNESEMKIWDTSALMVFEASERRGFLRLDCPCIMTFSYDTTDTVSSTSIRFNGATLTISYYFSLKWGCGWYGVLRRIAAGLL